MDIRDLSTAKMRYDPNLPTFKKEIEKIPNLAGRRFKTLRTMDVYRYIALMYDPNSPIHDEVSDPWQRRLEALEAAGFKLIQDLDEDGLERQHFDITTESMVLGEIEGVNEAIMDYLAYTSKIWKQLTLLSELQMQNIKSIMKGNKLGTQDTKTSMDVFEKMRVLENEMMLEGRDDTPKPLLKKLYSRIEDDKLKRRPEDYAKKFAAGSELAGDSPYGDKYPTTPKITFIGSGIPKS